MKRSVLLASLVALVVPMGTALPLHGAPASRRAPAAATRVPGPLPSPVLLRVERAPDGYVLIGRGFGADAGALKILEGSRELPRSAIVSITPDRIVVRSRVVGSVQHRVILSGRASAVITLDHGGRVAEPATTKNVTPVPGAGPPTGSSTSPRVAVGPTTPGSGVAVRGGPASSVAGAPLHIPSGMVMTGQIHMRGTRPLAAGGVGSPTAVPTGSPGMPSGGTASASSPGPGTAVATPGAAGTLGSGGGTASAQAGHPALPSNLETTPTIHMRGTRPLAATSGSPGNVQPAPPASGTSN